MKPLIKITVVYILVNKHPVEPSIRNKLEKTDLENHAMERLQCIVPVSTLDAVAKQPNKILVPDASDRFDLHLELLLSLAPGKSRKEVIFLSESTEQDKRWGEK